MNEVIKVIQSRRSVKKYTGRPVAQDVVQQIIEAGLYAASGRGQQAAIVVAVTNKKLRDKLAALNSKIGGWPVGFDPFYGAPAVLVVLANKACPTYVYDGSLALGNLMLAAHALGVGSCWIHRAKEEFETEEGQEILRSLGVEGEYEGIGHCVLGYPDCALDAPLPPRKDKRVFYAN